jgi:pilus assembly protein Flp/PilA
MSKIRNWALKNAVRFQAREEGQGLVEYGLIIALIAVVCIGALTVLGGGIGDTLDEINNAL